MLILRCILFLFISGAFRHRKYQIYSLRDDGIIDDLAV